MVAYATAKNLFIMATLTIQRLSQNKNKYGSFSYRIINGTPEEGAKTYGDNKDIMYSSQKLGVWNQPIQVEHWIGTNKTTGKTYNGLSIDQELNSFTQRGYTATLATKAGLDVEKIAMLKMIAELDEQEMKVKVLATKLVSPTVKPTASLTAPSKTAEIEEAEVVDENPTVNEELVQ